MLLRSRSLLSFASCTLYKFFTRDTICKYFLLVCGISLHFLDIVFWSTHFFFFFIWQNPVYLSFFPSAFGVIANRSWPIQRSERFTPMFSSRNFMDLLCIFAVWFILSEFLYLVWGKDRTSWFCLFISCFPRTMSWEDCVSLLNDLGSSVSD